MRPAGVAYPLVISGLGLIASVLATFFVKGDEKSNPHRALKMGTYVSSALVVVVSLVFSLAFFGSLRMAGAVISGLAVGPADRNYHRNLYISRL